MRSPARTYRSLTIAALLVWVTCPMGLRAQDAPPDSGPSERGVARVSIVNGEASVRRGDSGDWVAAVVNAPLMVEDRLSTGAKSRAEVQFDSANLIRVGANAEIRLAQLENGHYNIQVARGTVMFRILHESKAQVELDTPAVSVRPMKVGAYRVYVQQDGQVEITIRLGAAEIFTPQGSEQVQAGQTMLARGSASDPEYRIVPAIARDEWDRWNEDRDRELLSSNSNQNVPEGVYGAEDLDDHGEWVSDPAYGQVWAPEVDADWAPYQNGRWVWEDYYGWTWLSSDPWGWAPFHYGRWFHGARGWCWYPGGFGRHYWSPGLVAFFGFGPGTGVGFGVGSVGWVALAPHERLYPWWGHGLYAGYRNPGLLNHGASISNINVTNVYRNARVTNAVVSVPAGEFHQGRFHNMTRATGAQLHEAGLVRGQIPVAPSAANLRFSNRTVASATPRGSDNVRFFSRRTPAAVQRVPFAEQQRSMQQFSRQSAVTARSGGGANSTWRSVSPQGPVPAQPSNNGAWRPLNAPPSTAGNAGGYSPNRGSGWQRFGEPRPASATRGGGTESWNVPKPSYAQQPNNPPYRPAAAPIRVASPVVRERSSSAPRSAPSRSDGGSRTTRPSGGSGSGGSGGSRSSGGSGGGSHGGSSRH